MATRLYRQEEIGKWLILVLPVVFLAAAFVFYRARILCWFDPILLAYNALLLTAAILTPPVTAILYVNQMRDEKERRLRRDLGSDQDEHDDDRRNLLGVVRHRLDREFRFSNYIGAVVTAMLVTAMGAGILLMMKMVPVDYPLGPVDPACTAPGQQGVDFTKGATFLVLAAFMKDIGNPSKLYPNLIIGLVAFQFGFLGAWINFISQVARGYFMCDLTPNTFVHGSIRMVTASLLALVLSFILPTLPIFGDGVENETFLRTLPVMAFFFGYFPSSALRVIENVGAKALGALLPGKPLDQWTPLSALSGMSYLHEVRLSREGIDNVEYLSQADPLDLALRTGFGYRQLDDWIGEAWLRKHLGEDYDAFAGATGIRSRQGLRAFLEQWTPTPPFERAQDLLAQALDPKLHGKLEVTCLLACESADSATAHADTK